ncbi:MAG: transcriptional regulator [Candidatus Krumholzibacteriia bacterium]
MPRTPAHAGEGDGPLSSLIHGRVRLLVLSRLLTADRPHSFTELRDGLGLTDGTLSIHLQKLETAGILALEKRFVEKRPQTLVHVTDQGRADFARYVEELRRIVPGLRTG